MRRISAGTALTLSMLLLGPNLAAAGTQQQKWDHHVGRSGTSFYEFCKARSDGDDWKRREDRKRRDDDRDDDDRKRRDNDDNRKRRDDDRDDDNRKRRDNDRDDDNRKRRDDDRDDDRKRRDNDGRGDQNVLGQFSTTGSDSHSRSRTDDRDDHCRELLRKLRMRQRHMRERHDRTCGDNSYRRRTCDHDRPSKSGPRWEDVDRYKAGKKAQGHWDRANSKRKAGKTWVDRAHRHHERANDEWAHYYEHKDRDPRKAKYHHSRAKKHEQQAERCWRHADDSYDQADGEQDEAEQLIKLLTFLLRLLEHHQMASS